MFQAIIFPQLIETLTYNLQRADKPRTEQIKFTNELERSVEWRNTCL